MSKNFLGKHKLLIVTLVCGKKMENGNCSHEMVFEEVKIPVPWGYIAGKWWGDKKKQPVIALHGWQDNAGTFDNLAELLVKENISVLCIDLPGHGFSSHYPEGVFYYIFWDGVHFLRRIISHYEWKNVQLMGHSMGGAISFLYACIFPNDIDCYISIDIASPAVRNLDKILDKLGDGIDKFFKYEKWSKDQMPCYDYEQMIDIVQAAYGGSCTRDSCEIMMKRGMQPDGKGSYHFSRDSRLKLSGLAMMDIDQAVSMCKRIKCRVMNIRGNPGMKFDNPEYYEMVLDEIEKSAKELERHVVEGTHHLHLNTPERISGIIAAFLKKK